MKLELRSNWLRVVVELLRPVPTIRRYQVVPPSLQSPMGRFLQQRILRELARQQPQEGA